MAENQNKISQIQVGSVTYDICDPIARDFTAYNKGFKIIDSNHPSSNGTVETAYYSDSFGIYDNNGETPRGKIRTVVRPTGEQGIQLETSRNINDSGVSNTLNLYVGTEGTRSVSVTAPAAGRTALGLGSISPGTSFYSSTVGNRLAGSQSVSFTANDSTYLLSNCMTGIVLHWQPYDSTEGAAKNQNHQFYFIPKNAPTGHSINIPIVTYSEFVVKQIVLYNDHIEGHDNNNQTALALGSTGITMNTKGWVLTEVIAV